MELELRGHKTTVAESLGLKPPTKARLVEAGQPVKVLLEGESRVVSARYLRKLAKGKIKVRLDDGRQVDLSPCKVWEP